MNFMSSAILAASLGPPGSSQADTIQTISIAIPIVAILLIIICIPQFKNSVKGFFGDYKETMHGPETAKKKEEDQEESQEKVEPEGSSADSQTSSVSNNEMDTFDFSFYDDEEDEK